MERYMFVGVLGFCLLAVFIGVFLTPGKPPGEVHLPWQIEITEAGNSKVFGVEIGRSTLDETATFFREPPVISLFESKDGERVVEAYFDSVDISGLRAQIIVVMNLNKEQLDGMYLRGERLANMGGGRHKITLTSADEQFVRGTTFSSLSYIPRHNLSAELIKGRFGEPAERIGEVGKSKVEHWLYPDKGLDIALSDKAKEVLQYVSPARFEAVRRPLMEQAASAK